MYDYNDNTRAKNAFYSMFNDCNYLREASGKNPYTLEEYKDNMSKILTKLSNTKDKRFPYSFLKCFND